MTYVRGLVCRESGHGVRQSPVHICEQCFGPLEVDYDYVLVPVRPRTAAKSLAIGNPADGYYDAQAVRESGGWIGRDEPVVVCITGSGLTTVEALEPQLAAPVRVGASLAAVEAVLPELQAVTTR